MEKLADIALNGDMDIEVVDGDLKIDTTLKNSIRVALMTSSRWWGNQYGLTAGSTLSELFRRGKITDGDLRRIKQMVYEALQYIGQFNDFSVEVRKDRSVVTIIVSIQEKEVYNFLWKLPLS